MARDETRVGGWQWALATFLVLDALLARTRLWNGERPWVQELPSSFVHDLLSSSIYALDACLLAVVLGTAIAGGWRWLTPTLAYGASLGVALAWTELWYAAVHHAGHHIHGGIVTAVVLGAYVTWTVPTRRWVRIVATSLAVFAQVIALQHVEEPWRLWH